MNNQLNGLELCCGL